MQRSPARMEPCVRTAWEATTVSASRVSQGSTVKMVRSKVGIIIVKSHLCCSVTAATFPFCFHDADETRCTVESGKGCSQFCKPGYTSYECSCAQGWKLSHSDRKKCEPAGTSGSSIKFQLKLKCSPPPCYSLHICSVNHISHQKQKREKFTFYVIVLHDGSSYFFL